MLESKNYWIKIIERLHVRLEENQESAKKEIEILGYQLIKTKHLKEELQHRLDDLSTEKEALKK